MIRAITFAAIFAISCHRSGLDGVRYVNAPVVTAVNDRAHTPDPPAESLDLQLLEHYDSLVYDRLMRPAELNGRQLALDINALGEVPDSTWFTNRISARDLSADEIRRGPNRGSGPEARKPWKVVSSKAVGVAPGFIFEDAAGDRYLLKLDLRGHPESESGAHIIVHRLLWALGYNVPEDWLVTFGRGDLEIAAGAVVSDELGEKRPMTSADLDAVLARGHASPIGAYRAIASEFVPGKPLGGFAESGVRRDDPNDTIEHQHRRVLRGLYPIFAWLKHTDIKQGNFLDTYVDDPERPGRRYVRHYLIDFGKALGVLARISKLRADGHAHWIDFDSAGRSLLTAGLYKRPWDGLETPRYRGVGIYEVARYDPGRFEVRFPWEPFEQADDRDRFWGAKLMMRLRPEHIRAAVEAARYSSPEATRYMIDTLIARQRITARHWFRRANPLDRFAARRTGDGLELCFDDLARTYRLESRSLLRATRYRVRAFDYAGERLGYRAQMTLDPRTGRLCAVALPMGRSRSGYTIIAIDTLRPGTSDRPVLVHVAEAPESKEPRVIGVRRR